MKRVIVTTSWDDGHILDIRLAALLKKYGIKGTFYVSPHDREFHGSRLLKDQQVKDISAYHEIGAHTMSHPRLTHVDDQKAYQEALDSRLHLEAIIKKPVVSFCYPGGNYAKRHVSLMKKAGFLYARTTKRFSRTYDRDLLQAKTTVNTYNHYQDILKVARLARFNPLKTYRYFHWEELAKAQFDKVLREGGVFHLWGHSWEVEGHNDWAKLEAVLQYISKRQGVEYLTNGQLAAKTPKTVLIAAPYFPPHTGGQEFYAATIAKQLQTYPHWRVVVVTSGRRGLRKSIRYEDGVKIYALPYWFKLSNTPLHPLWYTWLRRIIKKESVDVLNTHAPVPYMAECAHAAARKLPIVFTYHMLSMKKGDWKFDWLIGIYERFILPRGLRKATSILASSKAVREEFLQQYAYKTHVVSPGVDTERFLPHQSRRSAHPTILFNGTLHKNGSHKGLSILLDALPDIVKKVPQVELLVVGAGNAHHEYVAQAKALGVVKHVTMLGTKYGDDLVRVYQSAHVFAQPSLNDSYPMALVEALAAGLPCVATKVGSLPSIVDDGLNGFIVSPGDPQALAEKLTWLLLHPKRAAAMGGAGRQKALQQMEWKEKVAAVDGALLSALESARLPQVVQITPYYPPHMGGMEHVVRELSLQLTHDRYRTQVVTAASEGTTAEDPFLVQRLKATEVAHTPIIWRLLPTLLRAPKRSIFHIHAAIAGVPEIAMLVAKCRRIPTVVHYHLDVDPSGRFGFLLNLYKRTLFTWTLRSADRVLVFSDEQATRLQSVYGVDEAKIRIVQNGVAEQFYLSKKRTAGKTLRILYVGRLSVQKRVERLIGALKRTKTECQLTIVGDGEERQQLEELAAGAANIRFAGIKSGADLLHMYESHDVLALSSDKEGMSLTMLEGMAAGLPVIASDVSGISEHLSATGILVKDPSADSFAAAFDAFYRNRVKRIPMLSAASKTYAARFTWPRAVEQIEAIYAEIAHGRRRDRSFDADKIRLFAAVGLWWLAVLAVRDTPQLPAFITNMVSFGFIMVVPGALTMLCLPLKRLPPIAKAPLALGLSVLEVMTLGLLSNTILQWLHSARPLDAASIAVQMTAGLVVLFICVWRYGGSITYPSKALFKKLYPTPRDRIFAVVPTVFVLGSVLGAVSLNNGGSNGWVIALLGGIALYSFLLMYRSRRLSDATIATALYFIALSLLFMTSLRGWFVTGHDIQREFGVFMLAKSNGVWRIQDFRDPYNACLSITILPTMFSAFLKSQDATIFKVFFQIIFAALPSLLYIFTRKWASKALAFAAMLYFVSFPTFFSDMPMLNRQEIALIFFGLMLYLLFQDELSLRIRRYLFLLFGLGLVMSHYSTTYSVIIILLISALCRPFILWIAKRIRGKTVVKQSALKSLQVEATDMKRLTITAIVCVTVASFLWTSVVTNTGNNTGRVIKATLVAALNSFKEDGPKANETNYNLLTFSKADLQKELDKYSNHMNSLRDVDNTNTYYIADPYKSYKLISSTSAELPLTTAGKYLENHAVNVASFNLALRQGSAKLLQLFIFLGVAYILFRRALLKSLDTDYLTLVFGCTAFVILQVILPVISVEYGLLRAFQQSLMLLSIFVVMGTIVAATVLPHKKIRALAPIIAVLLFFVSSTGVMTQALGRYPAQLHLNNRGSYYDMYYTHRSDEKGIAWLQARASQGDEAAVSENVQSDHFSFAKGTNALYETSAQNDIYPGLVRRDSYVYLGYQNVVKGEATVSYNGNTLTYVYPVHLLDTSKNLVYSSGGAKVYK